VLILWGGWWGGWGGSSARAEEVAAVNAVRPGTAPTSTTVTTTTGEGEAAPEEPSPFGFYFKLSQNIGLGSFVGGTKQQVSSTTDFWPTVSYRIVDNLTLAAAIVGSWYQKVDYGTAYENGKFIFSDLYFDLGHSKIYHNPDAANFTLGANFRIYLPTSLSSQYQNRVLSARAMLNSSLKLGPVSVGYSLGFMKYFNRTTYPTLQCADFDDEGLCRDGNGQPLIVGPTAGGGISSERSGGEIFLPSAGVYSFYVLNALVVDWEIVEGLVLEGSATVYNLFGYRAFAEDGLSSPNARTGRSHIDRLITEVNLTYTPIKELQIGLGFTTDTTQPFGESGNDLVVFNFSRAPTNNTNVWLRLATSL
jgi:hypothetical protein